MAAIWGRGEMHIFRNVKVADNAMGYTHASGSAGRDPFTSKVVDSLFVGETENIGNPQTDAEKAYGRSLPKPMMPDFRSAVMSTTTTDMTWKTSPSATTRTTPPARPERSPT